MVQRPGVPTAPVLVPETDLGSTEMSPGRTHHVAGVLTGAADAVRELVEEPPACGSGNGP
ncbi:hypothetical protein ACGFYQ_20955 [Streptomyces sp. NPDC048258]|uniref:hypothetical protein n=1 Tax=Streptomyces sp. NPDC048258 TaxID=3365527 RepID=UPI00372300C4